MNIVHWQAQWASSFGPGYHSFHEQPSFHIHDRWGHLMYPCSFAKTANLCHSGCNPASLAVCSVMAQANTLCILGNRPILVRSASSIQNTFSICKTLGIYFTLVDSSQMIEVGQGEWHVLIQHLMAMSIKLCPAEIPDHTCRWYSRHEHEEWLWGKQGEQKWSI